MLRLRIDAAGWRAHQRAFVAESRRVVPVVKGNGYGFGRSLLFAEVSALRADAAADLVAVGTYAEAHEALSLVDCGVLVMSPWRAADAVYDRRLIHTVSRIEDVSALARAPSHDAPPRVLLEGLTTMRRHGVDRSEVAALGAAVAAAGRAIDVVGLALHHPIEAHRAVHPVDESALWLDALTAAGVRVSSVYVSHLTPGEVADLAERYPTVDVRPRIGTALWLGDRSAFGVTATVLDLHPVRRGERYGYRQRRAPMAGSIVIVSGGTAHGIGLEGPSAPRGVVERGKRLAIGGLESAGFALSPYHWRGRQRWFAEPPHMQVSMLFLPERVPPPAPGTELDVDVRMTISTFDDVLLSST
jgi:hypothetical protein